MPYLSMAKWLCLVVFFFSSRRRHTRYIGDWSSDVCSSDLARQFGQRRALDHVAVVGALGHDEPSIFGARGMILRALVPDCDAHEIRVLGLRSVPFEEAVRQLVVLQLLVDVAMSVLVDEEHRVAG